MCFGGSRDQGFQERGDEIGFVTLNMLWRWWWLWWQKQPVQGRGAPSFALPGPGESRPQALVGTVSASFPVACCKGRHLQDTLQL